MHVSPLSLTGALPLDPRPFLLQEREDGWVVAVRIETAFILLWPGALEKRGRMRSANHVHLAETFVFQLLILVPPPSSVLNLPSSPQCQVSDNKLSPYAPELVEIIQTGPS